MVELLKVNVVSVNSQIIAKLSNFFNNDLLKLQKIKLLLSDAAPYAIKAGKALKELIPSLKHVTCLCHGLHNLCETIRDSNSDLDKFVAFLKCSLVKNSSCLPN